MLAGELRAGDELEARGERVVVTAVQIGAEQTATFNFEVACHHTYRVSGEAQHPAILVHNTSLAVLKSIRRKAERLVQIGETAAGRAQLRRQGYSREVVDRVRRVNYWLDQGNLGAAGTHFHSLNFRFADRAQQLGHLRNIIREPALFTGGLTATGRAASRRPDYLTLLSGRTFDIKPWHPSPGHYASSGQFMDIARMTGSQPIPLYYRLR